MSRQKALEIAKQIITRLTETKDFNRVASKCKVVDGNEGRCVCELTIEEEHANSFGTLHGGLTASLVDIISTAALVTTPRAQPGVSVDLNVSYLRGAKIGETVIFDAYVVKLGKTLAFTQVDVKSKASGEIVALARHTKAMPPPS